MKDQIKKERGKYVEKAKERKYRVKKERTGVTAPPVVVIASLNQQPTFERWKEKGVTTTLGSKDHLAD